MPPGFDPTDDEIELWTPMTFTPKERSDESRHSNNARVHRSAEAGRHARTGAGADRRVERRQPRSIPAVQGSHRQRGLSHRRQSTAGPDGQGRQSHIVPDVGRSAVRASDRVRQRRQPGARPVARAVEGARDAPGSRRRAPGESRDSSPSNISFSRVARPLPVSRSAYVALQSMGALSLQELPRSQDIRLDAIVVMYTLAAAVAIGLVLGLIPVAATLSANVLGVLREEGRTATSGPWCAIASARTRRDAGRLRVPPVDWRWPPVRQFQKGACGRSGIHDAGRADRRGVAARVRATPMPSALRRFTRRSRAACARIAGRESGRCDRQPATREQRERVRHSRGGIPGEAGRIASGAGRGPRLRRLLRGHRRKARCRTLLHRT